MDVLDAIMSRQSTPGVLQDMPPREYIELMLTAATRAPNHYLTQPWRFFVISGEQRQELGRVMEESLRQRLTDEPDEKKVEGQAMAERTKLLRAPVVIIVAVNHDPANAHIPPFEDMVATGAAVENMLLAAHGLGLAAYWRSGFSVLDPMVKNWLGLTDDDELVGFIYVGHPDPTAPERPHRDRDPIDAKTQWYGWGGSKAESSD